MSRSSYPIAVALLVGLIWPAASMAQGLIMPGAEAENWAMAGASTAAPLDAAGSDAEAGGPLECPGMPSYCQGCMTKFSWNKGGWRIVPFGTLTGQMVASTSDAVTDDFVLYVLPDSPQDNNHFSVHGKSSSLGFLFSGPQVCGLQSGGMIYMVFFGETAIDNITGPMLLLAFGELRNECWRFAFGHNLDVINPLMPTSLNFGMGMGAGNIGFFRGQIRAERYFYPAQDVQWAVQFAVSDQVITEFVMNPLVTGGDNGWPNLEGRIALGMGPMEPTNMGMIPAPHRPFEVGVSGLIGETRATAALGERVSTTWAVGADGRFKLTERLGVQGELFYGQAIGTYNGGIFQSLQLLGAGDPGTGIRAVGGWGEIWYFVCPEVHLHVGCGVDDPLDRDLAPGQRLRNKYCFGNVIWNVTEQFQVGFETSYYETSYLGDPDNDAVVYLTNFQLSF